MYSKNFIKKILTDLVSRRVSVKDAYKTLADLPYKDLGFAKLDNHRRLRRGFPEVIYCGGKSPLQIEKILNALWSLGETILLTAADKALYNRLLKRFPNLKYSHQARMVFTRPRAARTRKKGRVLIITGGTADIGAAEEARVTLELMGNRVSTLYDVGVAGLHRLLDRMRLLKSAKVIIVIAGMEGALASVVSGLVSRPVIAVPTSVGYGANFKGIAPLLTMLNSCSPGVGVVNIDNGFGAGYLAGLINK